jgi:hypothetical protein
VISSTPVASTTISFFISLKAIKLSVQYSYNRFLKEADSQEVPVIAAFFPRYPSDSADEHLVAFLRSTREPELEYRDSYSESRAEE